MGMLMLLVLQISATFRGLSKATIEMGRLARSELQCHLRLLKTQVAAEPHGGRICCVMRIMLTELLLRINLDCCTCLYSARAVVSQRGLKEGDRQGPRSEARLKLL